VSVALGTLALVALGWFALLALAIRATAGGAATLSIWAPQGVGGTERMIVYPILLWVVVFGAACLVLPDPFGKPVAVATPEKGQPAETGRAELGSDGPADPLPSGLHRTGRS
jgi:hypothetical protein